MAVTPNGASLIVGELRQGQPSDLLLLPLQGDRRPRPLVQTPFTEINGEISLDGQWLAYESNESGRFEVYVRPFPNVDDGRWQVSPEGGTHPLWARSGRELLYATPSGDALMASEVSTRLGFKASAPVRLLDTRPYYFAMAAPGVVASPGRMYEVSPDGSRFLLLKARDDSTRAGPALITVVQNWDQELKRLVPARTP